MPFEEYSLTSPKEKKETLPELIRVGSFARSVPIPAMLPFSMANGLVFEVDEKIKVAAHLQLEFIALTLLKKVNTDLINLCFVDIGINTSFKNLHRLKIPNIKFISEKTDLKNQLLSLYKLARHINTSYFTNEINTLTKFNDTTEYKEPYNILFIPNFPKDFNDDEIEMLIAIIREASNCGIYTFATLDESFLPENTIYNQGKINKILEVKKYMITLDCKQTQTKLNNLNVPIIQKQFNNFPFEFENYKEYEINNVINEINNTVCSKYQKETNFLSIPIGRNGREEFFFELGSKADAYHCMIAGQTRTGKSTFLNLIITKIAELYTPEEIRLYLLDYKEGVEFGVYRNHPNVECLLLDNSNIEFAIEVLEKFENEITSRSQLFGNFETPIRNILKYNAKAEIKLPHLILIIDEVQELFTRNSDFSRKINKILTRVTKQGGAFGIHLIFCTQSYLDCKIDDAIINQTKLRVAFRLSNGAECRAVLGRDNETPIQLKRFQIVYNSENGLVDKNIIVKTYNFDEEEIEPLLLKKKEEYKTFINFNKLIIEKGTSTKNEMKNDEYGFK